MSCFVILLVKRLHTRSLQSWGIRSPMSSESRNNLLPKLQQMLDQTFRASSVTLNKAIRTRRQTFSCTSLGLLSLTRSCRMVELKTQDSQLFVRREWALAWTISIKQHDSPLPQRLFRFRHLTEEMPPKGRPLPAKPFFQWTNFRIWSCLKALSREWAKW